MCIRIEKDEFGNGRTVVAITAVHGCCRLG